jgi:ABC-type nickel/cobalt efflux system permease component RcnA
VTTLGQVLIAASVLAVGIVYGTDVFCAIILRPALALVDDRTLVSTMGRVHDFGDRRLRVPGVVGLISAVAGTAVIAVAGHLGATIAGAIAVLALAIWLVIYVRVSAPVNARLTAAAKHGETPSDARLLQQRWDSVIAARSGLQLLAILSLCTVLITS